MKHRLHRIVSVSLALGVLSISSALAGRHDELGAWLKQDCDDYRTLVIQIDHGRSGHDVAAAMRENVRRQHQTINTLLQFARAHPDLRDAAQLGLSEDGQRFWREHNPNRTTLPAPKSRLHNSS